MKIKYDLGLFGNPYLPDDFIEGKKNTDEAASLASEVAQKSIVLLKNNDIVPLEPNDASKKVSLIGPFVDTVDIYGCIRLGVHEQLIIPRQAIIESYVHESNLETHRGMLAYLYYDLNIISYYLFSPS